MMLLELEGPEANTKPIEPGLADTFDAELALELGTRIKTKKVKTRTPLKPAKVFETLLDYAIVINVCVDLFQFSICQFGKQCPAGWEGFGGWVPVDDLSAPKLPALDFNVFDLIGAVFQTLFFIVCVIYYALAEVATFIAFIITRPLLFNPAAWCVIWGLIVIAVHIWRAIEDERNGRGGGPLDALAREKALGDASFATRASVSEALKAKPTVEEPTFEN